MGAIAGIKHADEGFLSTVDGACKTMGKGGALIPGLADACLFQAANALGQIALEQGQDIALLNYEMDQVKIAIQDILLALELQQELDAAQNEIIMNVQDMVVLLIDEQRLNTFRFADLANAAAVTTQNVNLLTGVVAKMQSSVNRLGYTVDKNFQATEVRFQGIMNTIEDQSVALQAQMIYYNDRFIDAISDIQKNSLADMAKLGITLKGLITDLSLDTNIKFIMGAEVQNLVNEQQYDLIADLQQQTQFLTNVANSLLLSNRDLSNIFDFI